VAQHPGEAGGVDLSCFSLEGQVAIVTGATSGLGLEIAKGFARCGARVYVNGRRREVAEAAAASIPNAAALCFDVADHHQREAAIARVTDREGQLDILVGNAGIRDRRPLDQISPEDFAALMDVNLTANFALAKLAAPYMIENGSGRLIFVTSAAGPQAAAANASYTASKGGLAALVRALAVELGPHGICTNAISPGFFATEFNAALAAHPRAAYITEKRIPLRRWARPEEIAGAAVFLASAAASYINGHTLAVDGGVSISL
jgi:gluconate 5-dehydrogenase